MRLSQFTKTRDAISINRDDDYRLKELTTEVIDLISDHIPNSVQHARMVAQAAGAPGNGRPYAGSRKIDSTMKIKDLRPFVPSKDYEKSKAFYVSLGFSMEDAGPNLCILTKGQCTFFLQKYYNEELAKNLMFQLIVQDINEAHAAIKDIENIDIKHSPIKQESWAKVIYLWGPSGELWHVTELNS